MWETHVLRDILKDLKNKEVYHIHGLENST